jgi:hypothetical protein
VRYSPVSWTLDNAWHPDVVQELVEAGLEPAGRLANDLSPERDRRLLRGYDEDVRAQLAASMGRAFPLLLSPDREVAVEVSDLAGRPVVRMRTFLDDGSLVETERRWGQVPPWPGRLAPFRRFATVEGEMTRSVAPGRTLVISDRPPAGQLEEHRGHVEAVCAARSTEPRPFADLDQVAAGWNAAFAHDQLVTRRTDILIAVGVVVLVIAGTWSVPSGVLGGPLWPVTVAFVIALVWWLMPGLVVLLRRRITWRPGFPAARGVVP